MLTLDGVELSLNSLRGGMQGALALTDYRSFPRTLADILSARKVISLITPVIKSQLI